MKNASKPLVNNEDNLKCKLDSANNLAIYLQVLSGQGYCEVQRDLCNNRAVYHPKGVCTVNITLVFPRLHGLVRTSSASFGGAIFFVSLIGCWSCSLVHLVLHAKDAATICGPTLRECIGFSARNTNMHKNLQTLQGYTFRILRYFATELCRCSCFGQNLIYNGDCLLR